MEITQGNLAAVFSGFDARFKLALTNVAVPGVGRIVVRADGVSTTDEYPMSGLLGDLEPQVDEVYMQDLWMMVQQAKATLFSTGLNIRRQDIEDDRLNLYQAPIQQLAVMARTRAYRGVGPLLMAGFTSIFLPDGETHFSDDHEWPGGVLWDNYEHLPLTAGNFDIACQHLEERRGPNNQPLGLSPKLTVVGPGNRAAAETILNMQLVGGSSNRQYKRTDLIVLPQITNLNWFVMDDDPFNVAATPGREGETETAGRSPIRPILYDVRRDVEAISQANIDSDESFERDRFRYKAAIRFALLMIAPWLIQASDWVEDATTTTTTEQGN